MENDRGCSHLATGVRHPWYCGRDMALYLSKGGRLLAKTCATLTCNCSGRGAYKKACQLHALQDEEEGTSQ
jgi:hypothetical protein